MTNGSDDQRQERSRARKAAMALPVTLAMPFVLLWRSLRGIWGDPASQGILVVAAWLLVAGTLIFMLIEDYAPLDSFYFCFITLATIGYGDITPTTDLGKIMTVIYSIAGLGIMAALVSSIAAYRTRTMRAGDADGSTRRRPHRLR